MKGFRDVMTPGVSQSAVPSCDSPQADGAERLSDEPIWLTRLRRVHQDRWSDEEVADVFDYIDERRARERQLVAELAEVKTALRIDATLWDNKCDNLVASIRQVESERDAQRERAEKAEARVARLVEAMEKVADGLTDAGINGFGNQLREALEEK